VRSLSRRLVALFASPLGVFVLAALDGTLFFSLPFGIDAVVIILSARLHGRAWLVPLLATAGSLTGAALTFWMGVKIGDAGLERYVPRFGIEAVLTVWYGRRISLWLDSQLFQNIVAGCIGLAVILTTLSIVRVIRSTKRSRRSAAV
jgi:membrane protein YqaA with SNARE-associated domain